MKKIFSFIVESIFWLQFFITPIGIGGLIALFIYISNENLLWLSIAIVAICVVLGVWYAEKIKRKHGTSRYAAKRIATPDIWPDEYPEEIEARKKEREMKEAKEKEKKDKH